MTKAIFILGTDTDVGKTVVSAGLMYQLLNKGHQACYFKPISSGAIEEDGEIFSYDLSFVKKVSGLQEDDNLINPYRFKTPVSPHLASPLENKPIHIPAILKKYELLKSKYDYLIVEGCGGLAVPLTTEYMQYEFIKDLNISCLLVTRTTLGTINHTTLTLKVAEQMGIPIEGILFNGYKGSMLEDNNIETIRKMTSVPVLAVLPAVEALNVEKLESGNLKEIFSKAENLEAFLTKGQGLTHE
ncbi:dethiobiotin synthase [Heliorestis acidaminivorans]|uniref:ATP-dependent dethiobiotin synthetase BioD n=1 Tax=Heliorestis acidaminivorans TaxID=553427 RepID=A0A6I0EXZ4_9FIRM|nr:dethiobiotin synthase [Heliorestis acidaminivorans]KAB2952123.1 dethiobiotin synthase [Heliorestis acidaminivorans]